MKRMLQTLPITLMLLLVFMPLYAATIAINDDLTLELYVPSDWVLSDTAPDALLKEIAEHIAHEAEAQGANPTTGQLMEAAQKRMAANEAILYHPTSGAHLDIDFSPLDPGQKPPGSKVLRNSARYAVQSLKGEEGVARVTWEINPIQIRGAKNAYLLTANYTLHDHPMRFLGVIGFVPDQWFFFYYTDPMKQEGTYTEMQKVLRSMILKGQ